MQLTYHSRAWVRDFSLEWDPLVVGPLFVSKGPQECPPDVIHRVETHGRAFKYTAAGTWRYGLEITTDTHMHPRAHTRTHTQIICVDSDLDVEKMVYTRGFFLSLVCSRNTSPADGHTHTHTYTPQTQTPTHSGQVKRLRQRQTACGHVQLFLKVETFYLDHCSFLLI